MYRCNIGYFPVIRKFALFYFCCYFKLQIFIYYTKSHTEDSSKVLVTCRRSTLNVGQCHSVTFSNIVHPSEAGNNLTIVYIVKDLPFM